MVQDSSSSSLKEQDRAHLRGCQEGARAPQATVPLQLGSCPVLSSKPGKAALTDVTDTELSVIPVGPYGTAGPRVW